MLVPTTARMNVTCELQVFVPEGAKLFHAAHGPAIEDAVEYWLSFVDHPVK